MKKIIIYSIAGLIALCLFVAYINFGGVYLFPWTIKSLNEKAYNGNETAFYKLEKYHRFHLRNDDKTIEFYRKYKDKYGTCSPLIHYLLDRNSTGDKEKATELMKDCEEYKK